MATQASVSGVFLLKILRQANGLSILSIVDQSELPVTQVIEELNSLVSKGLIYRESGRWFATEQPDSTIFSVYKTLTAISVRPGCLQQLNAIPVQTSAQFSEAMSLAVSLAQRYGLPLQIQRN